MNMDNDNNNDICYTEEEMSVIIKQALVQTLIDFYEHKPYGRRHLSNSNNTLILSSSSNQSNEFLMAHYLTLPSTSQHCALPLHETSYFSVAVSIPILTDIMNKYKHKLSST